MDQANVDEKLRDFFKFQHHYRYRFSRTRRTCSAQRRLRPLHYIYKVAPPTTASEVEVPFMWVSLPTRVAVRDMTYSIRLEVSTPEIISTQLISIGPLVLAIGAIFSKIVKHFRVITMSYPRYRSIHSGGFHSWFVTHLSYRYNPPLTAMRLGLVLTALLGRVTTVSGPTARIARPAHENILRTLAPNRGTTAAV